MNPDQLLITLLTIVAIMGVILGIDAYLILLERKVAAWMQDRVGPNRVGPGGLLQPIADGLKFLFKEDVIPARADKLLYIAAPSIAAITALFAFAVVPFGPTVAGSDPGAYGFVIAPNVDVGIVLIFAVTSLTVYAIILGGWASNNKYSFIGALRSSAQLVSYEIPMGMSVLGVVLLTGSLNLEKIIAHQTEWGWNIFFQPLGFLLFMVSAFAECNRLPFDLPEAEQELVGGYHTEYSALKFALFFLGEYTHMITTSFLMAILFLGGWHFPGIPESGWLAVALKLVVIWAKAAIFILFYMFVRWTLPRFRFDQLMGMAWRVLIPLALVNLVAVMVLEQLIYANRLDPSYWRWVLLPLSVLVLIGVGMWAALQPARRRAPIEPRLWRGNRYALTRTRHSLGRAAAVAVFRKALSSHVGRRACHDDETHDAHYRRHGLDRGISGGTSGFAAELSRRAPAQPRRRRAGEVRCVLHVRHGVPGALHRHHCGAVALAGSREIPGNFCHRRIALHLLRHVRRGMSG